MRLLLKLSLFALAAAPLAARAASYSDITFTDQNTSTDQYQFIVPTSSLISSANTDGSTYFYLSNVTVYSPGQDILDPPNPPIPGTPVSSTSETVLFYNQNYVPAGGDGGGLLDNNTTNVSLNIEFFGATVFSSIASDIATFTNGAAGVIQGYDQNPLDNPVNFNFSVAAYTAPSATPEPSSLILLGTGALGIAGAFRRRLLA
jgi:hypothetical protein